MFRRYNISKNEKYKINWVDLKFNCWRRIAGRMRNFSSYFYSFHFLFLLLLLVFFFVCLAMVEDERFIIIFFFLYCKHSGFECNAFNTATTAAAACLLLPLPTKWGDVRDGNNTQAAILRRDENEEGWGLKNSILLFTMIFHYATASVTSLCYFFILLFFFSFFWFGLVYY